MMKAYGRKSNIKKYNKTIYACFTGYIVQAIVINFIPLLFITFQQEYGIPLIKITFLVTINFLLQLSVDFAAIFFVDKIGYRVSAILAHIFSATGFILLATLPTIIDPFIGILIAVVVYANGGGLLEVVMSPIVEMLPTENKGKAMSLLHSFYCWGHVGVILFSTIFFAIFGIENWKILALIWAIIPIINGVAFLKVPIVNSKDLGHEPIKLKTLFTNKIFLVFMLIMVCSGASEQAIAQWASALAEKSLGIDKMIGDLVGPMLFATSMGLSRMFHGKYAEKIKLKKFMIMSGWLAIILYLVIVFVPIPIVGLISCALSGFSVGIMWPGTFSMAASKIKGGGTAMFALLALAGDLGCSLGPTVVGFISNNTNDNLKMGILGAVIFPIMVVVLTVYVNRLKKINPKQMGLKMKNDS